MSNPQNKREDPGVSLCFSGALAAASFREACKAGPDCDNPLQVNTIRDAAMDIKNQLEALARSGGDRPLPPALLAEGAARCADLSNLAACAVPTLPPEQSSPAVATVHLAAGTARAFVALIREHASADENGYAVRDARGAEWRVGLAVRQVGKPADQEEQS